MTQGLRFGVTMLLVSACAAKPGSAPATDGGAGGDPHGADANAFLNGIPYDGGPTCEEAGGTCLLGNFICATPAPWGPDTSPLYCPGEFTAAGIFCCLSQVEDCGQPAALTFSSSCALSSSGCQGPVPFPAPFYFADAGPSPPGPFPSGCSVTLPYCNQGVVPTCVCQGTTWSCSL